MRRECNANVDPFRELRQDMNQLLQGFFPGRRLGEALGFSAGVPAVNVHEDGDRLVLEAELPGFKLADVEIEVFADELVLKGERKAEVLDEKTVVHHRERATGAFSRRLKLPFAIDADQVSATLRDGVLTVVLPKAASHLPKKIVVTG